MEPILVLNIIHVLKKLKVFESSRWLLRGQVWKHGLKRMLQVTTSFNLQVHLIGKVDEKNRFAWPTPMFGKATEDWTLWATSQFHESYTCKATAWVSKADTSQVPRTVAGRSLSTSGFWVISSWLVGTISPLFLTRSFFCACLGLHHLEVTQQGPPWEI